MKSILLLAFCLSGCAATINDTPATYENIYVAGHWEWDGRNHSWVQEHYEKRLEHNGSSIHGGRYYDER
jgi:uncharacterized protein YceK